MGEPNPPENRNINTGGGNYSERIEGDYVQGNVVKNIFNFLNGQQLAPVGDPARPKNQRLLLADVKQEVTARLKQSLHNAVLINLGKEWQPKQVECPWRYEVKIGLKPAKPLPDSTTILEVFDSEEIAGKLLILGMPGSGKTTTQLELAQELIKRAEEQPDYPVPVLFNLSSWKDDRQFIADWLVAELKSKYGVSKKLGQEWVNNRQLVPLFDGLDELEPQRQALCVQLINQFLAGETRPLYLVVCSRIEEYSNYATQLNLNGAIYLQPLSNNQICAYLSSIEYIELWSTISSDIDLLELVKTPLILSITVLASKERSVEEWQGLTSTSNRLQYLLDAYVGRMLRRDINSRVYLKNKPPNARKTRMWLVWLAQQMQRESKTEFLIEEMQPAWLNSNSQLLKYRLIPLLISVLIFVLIYGLIFVLISGLFYDLLSVSGLTYGLNWLSLPMITVLFSGMLFCVKYPQIIKPIERIYIYNIDKTRIISVLIFGLMGWLIFGLIDGLIFGLISGLIFWLCYGQIDEQTDLTIENKKIPNQGIWKSASNAVFSGLISGLIFWLISKPIYGLIYGLCAGLIFGGIACIQHLTLRLILYRNGYIPWNYARFLDYCTERLFLQRVGGRYRFIHKMLQDHFAQMEFKRD